MTPVSAPPIATASITGLVLAGGRGQRMGGADKGLQMLHGKPLAAHVLARLAPQVGVLSISANRNGDAYAALGAPWRAGVLADTLPGFPGPLAGLLAGLRAAQTEWLLTAPCDSPWLPADLAERLTHAALSARADIVTATTTNAAGEVSLHPVFALVRTSLADDLAAFLCAGERKVRAWYARHTAAEVAFADERAFYNINSLQELAELERA
ncbi:molybdenum cofactor guanylyltransferase MobA [Paraburkholderia silvatlantica]|uniref:Molybdenum cofactor guanylyltransferase n=1 Tax=Paraburkholderia silvatlantica TaxID=321895 RepID=A0ABR6FRD9_9BURK|nr:molybdenum cofactor guanylyltransferase MobA [Paraburkholderia silvatlantica]MBB2929997.1 molybdopterin-guanine dinucleotide biosynthesis protein A [Paraburkholderia silvatlantica]PVY29682.1 molybdenum cofactor guanylyltransferase [Paraburkholderia silvatlantica]PXW31524.1 molybdenum cofactor guanylyltransferase [Paraburkholderia silvatlantica]